MIRSKIVFHQYFQHLWEEPNFYIPYRWHFLFHSRERVLPIPTWWNPIKWRLVWFVINRKWCKIEVINSSGAKIETSKGHQRNLESLGIIGSLLDDGILLFLELLARELLVRIIGWLVFQVFCCFIGFFLLGWTFLTALPSMGTSRPGPILVPFFVPGRGDHLRGRFLGAGEIGLEGFFVVGVKTSLQISERWKSLAKGRELFFRALWSYETPISWPKLCPYNWRYNRPLRTALTGFFCLPCFCIFPGMEMWGSKWCFW